MSAYVVVEYTPIDQEKLKRYIAAATPTVAAFAGTFLARGPLTILHGETSFHTKVVIEFPDRDQAENWYNSPEYQAIIPLRNEAMNSTFQLVG